MNKITDLKIYKRLLALLSAGVMALSSLPAFAEGEVEETTNETSITIIKEDNPVQVTFDEYMFYGNVDFASKMYPYAKITNDVYAQIFEAFYYINYENCRDVREEIDDFGFIFGGNLVEAKPHIDAFILELARIDVERIQKNADINKIFDFSTLILNSSISELTHEALLNYIEVYKKGTIDCDEYRELMEQLSVLKENNYFLGYCVLYNMLEGLHEHCILTKFNQKEIKEYFTLKGKEIADVNKKNYKDLKELYEVLSNKEDRTELEEYIVLWFTYPYGTIKLDEFSKAVNKIDRDYKEYNSNKSK